MLPDKYRTVTQFPQILLDAERRAGVDAAYYCALKIHSLLSDIAAIPEEPSYRLLDMEDPSLKVRVYVCLWCVCVCVFWYWESSSRALVFSFVCLSPRLKCQLMSLAQAFIVHSPR